MITLIGILISSLYSITCLSLTSKKLDFSNHDRLIISDDNCKLGDRIGSGANCYCFEARILSSDITVAAKLYNIRECRTASEKIERILTAEDKCLAKACPNLMACFATCGEGESQYLLYKKMDGTLDRQFPKMFPSSLPIEYKLEAILSSQYYL